MTDNAADSSDWRRGEFSEKNWLILSPRAPLGLQRDVPGLLRVEAEKNQKQTGTITGTLHAHYFYLCLAVPRIIAPRVQQIVRPFACEAIAPGPS